MTPGYENSRESQGVYGNPRRKKSSAPRQSFKLFNKSQYFSQCPKNQCFKCNKIVIYYWKCRQSKSMTENINKMIISFKGLKNQFESFLKYAKK